MNGLAPDIVVTTTDHDRLQRLLDHGAAVDPLASQLQEELDRATVVEPDEVPAGVVTVDSRVVAEDVDTGDRLDLELVWPPEARIDAGRVSVLAPVGAALLGLRVGQEIAWPMPNGRSRTLRVVSVHARR
jgi:regulator of nucleoside diphosphate kinase